MKHYWSTLHFLRLVGASLDALGVVLIAIAVILIEKSPLHADTLEELEDALNKERSAEGLCSILGVVSISTGFLLIMIAEVVSWVEKSRETHRLTLIKQA
jgi:hypothetical protein